MSKYQAGQVWTYKTRPGEEASRLTIVKVEPYGNDGTAVHVHVSGLSIKAPNSPGGRMTFVSHLPFAEATIEKCLVHLESENTDLPDYQEGYSMWKEQADKGEAGVFTISVAEALNAIEGAVSGGNVQSQPSDDMDQCIRKAHADRTNVPELCRRLLGGHVFIIATWQDPKSNQITVQDFTDPQGRSFLPFFSDETHFRAETKGSGLEDKGVSIDCNIFISMLHGQEMLLLNPGSGTPVTLRKSDFEPFLRTPAKKGS